MSPILVRPVREQLEHDRVIRLLQAKYKRKFEVAINPGQTQAVGVGNGPSPWYPDLVLHTIDRGRRLAGIVEVETAESVNHLEAMSQWAAFAKQRAEFHLYVPAQSIDVARRLCADHGIAATEVWGYHAVGDQIRFVLMQRAPGSSSEKAPAKPAAKAAEKTPKAAAKPVAKPAAPVKVNKAKPLAPSGRAAVKSASRVAATKAVTKAAPKAAPKKAATAKPVAVKAAAKGSRPVKPGKPAKSR